MNIKRKDYLLKGNLTSGMSKFAAKNIVESRPNLETVEPIPLNLLKHPRSISKGIQKSRSDYEQKLNSIFKTAGMGITGSATKLVYVSSRINLENLAKSNESNQNNSLKPLTERSNKVSFAICSPKITTTENPTNLLNREIEDFERRLEEYRNSVKNKDKFEDLYKANYSRFS